MCLSALWWCWSLIHKRDRARFNHPKVQAWGYNLWKNQQEHLISVSPDSLNFLDRTRAVSDEAAVGPVDLRQLRINFCQPDPHRLDFSDHTTQHILDTLHSGLQFFMYAFALYRSDHLNIDRPIDLFLPLHSGDVLVIISIICICHYQYTVYMLIHFNVLRDPVKFEKQWNYIFSYV